MSAVKSIAFGLVISAILIPGCASSGPHASPTRKADNGVLKACLFRPTDEMMKSRECTEALTQANITADDVKAIKSCKAKSTTAMHADEVCQAQMAKHPRVF